MHAALAGLTRRLAAPRLLTALAVCTVALFTFHTADAQTPAAGTPIGNQASATYLDASGTSRTVTSNLVTTIVAQVASFTLTANGVRTAAPGGQAAFPHTLTNTGNGGDTFPLSLVNLGGDNFDATGIQLYADADGNGVPDNFTALATTGPLAAGGVFRFVAVGNVPGTQVGGDIALLRVNAASTFDGAQTAFNTDQITVTGNAVINVTKAINVSNGNSPSGPYTYTLTYTNTGNTPATALRLTDVIPAGMTYVPGSARWSVTGATTLTDASNADAQGVVPNTVVYDFGVSGAGVTAVINQVAPGAAGTLTFTVNVNAGLAPQVINNSANYSYNDGVGNVGPFPTNLAPFTVNQAVSLTFTGQTIASAAQGATLAYVNTLTNTGNGTDRFDVVVGVGSFPGGTTYTLYQSDGVTPLTDTNANGIPDTGPVAAGASTNVVLQVQLPTGATGGLFSVGKTATSVANPAVAATATDVLTAITANVVDVTNNSVGGPGAGVGPEVSAVITNATDPATTTRFDLYVANGSAISDNFDLAASTLAGFGALTLPPGWSVTFRNAASTIITNTGNVPAGGNVLVYADVTVPAGAAAGLSDLYFRALSPVSGASDRIHDAVDVNEIRGLTLVPNNSAQVAPSGSVVYTHLLFNNGNVTEGRGVGSYVALATLDNRPGWTSVLYWDTNGSGVFDAGDVSIPDLNSLGGLAPGASVRLFVQVFAPAGAPLGQVNNTQVSALVSNLGYTSAAPAIAIANDVTTVINGQLTLLKQQVIDANCDGTGEGAFGVANITIGSIPGACLRYRITVTNNGTATVTNVIVSDATPANSVYSAAIPASTTVGGIVAPANGTAGTITANVGPLGPGASAVIEFGIRINP